MAVVRHPLRDVRQIRDVHLVRQIRGALQSLDVHRELPARRPAYSLCAWGAWAAVRRETAPARMVRPAAGVCSSPVRRLDGDRRSACRAQGPDQCLCPVPDRTSDPTPASAAAKQRSTCTQDAARSAASRFCARAAAAQKELRELAPLHSLRLQEVQPPPARHWLPLPPQWKTVRQQLLGELQRSAASRTKWAACPVFGRVPVPRASAVLQPQLPAAELPRRWGERALRLPEPSLPPS